MTTYVYETIPGKDGETPRYFEFRQSMNDAPLTKHPETGEAIRRVVQGGLGVLTSKPASANSGRSPSGGGSCGTRCGCH